MKSPAAANRGTKRPAQSDGAKYVDDNTKHLLDYLKNENYDAGGETFNSALILFTKNIPKHLVEESRQYCVEEADSSAPVPAAVATTVGMDHSTTLLMNSLRTRKVIEDASAEPGARKGKKVGNDTPIPTEFAVSDSALSILTNDTKTRISEQKSLLKSVENEVQRRQNMAKKIIFDSLVSALCP